MQSGIKPEQLTALNELFGSVMSPKDFALRMRALREVTISMYLKSEDLDLYKEEVREGYFWLGELIEILEKTKH